MQTIVTENPDLLKGQVSFEMREQELAAQEKAEADARKREKNTPFRDWYQFNKEYTEAMLWLVRTNAKAYEVLLFLLDQMDKLNAVACSYKVIQEALSMSQVTVARAIKVLKEHAFVEVYKMGTGNVYTVNKRIAWSSWGTNYDYCKFDAKIIIAKSEQEQSEPAELPKFSDIKAKKQKVLSTKNNTKA